MIPALAPHLAVVDGHPTTTSLDVAEAFGKRHDRVLRAIRNLECSQEFRLLNFGEVIVEYTNGKGGTQKGPAYNITRDGFSFLCMGFTGARAAQWKEAYIGAFNAMEAALTQPRPVLPPPQPAYMHEPWFVILRQQALVMQRRALARAVGVHESTLSQILNGTGKYGAGLAGTARIAAKVLRVFRSLVQPRQLVLL